MLSTPSKTIRYAHWLFGVAALGAVVVCANHFGETGQLWGLFLKARPEWLLAALMFQVGTYLWASLLLQIALTNGNPRPTIRSLYSLSVAKQFISQAMPSIGLSGNFFVAKALASRSVPRPKAIFVVLVNLLSYYIAFALAITVTVVSLWWLDDLKPAILISLTVFLALIVGVSLVIFWMGKNACRGLPKWIRDRVITPETDELFAATPANSPWQFWLIVKTSAIQLLTFASDAATLYCALLSLDQVADPFVVLSSFVAASAVAAIGLVPGGLGTFEGTCVAILHAHGMSIELALAATLLLRSFTFWLPMIPGFWLARMEMK